MGMGGKSTVGHNASPTTFFAPVSYGGDIVSGDIGSGPIGISGDSTAGGGSFDFKLDMPMPLPVMQLQNLNFIKKAKKYGKKAIHVGEAVVPVAGQAWKAIDNSSYDKYGRPTGKALSAADNAYNALHLQNLNFFHDVASVGKKAYKDYDVASVGKKAYKVGKEVVPAGGKAWQAIDAKSYDKYVQPARQIEIASHRLWDAVDKFSFQNLNFLDSLGNGLEKASNYGHEAYMIGKKVAPVAGDVWHSVDEKSYDKYAVPGTATFMDIKNTGKSMGGWNEVNHIGGELNGRNAAEAAAAQKEADEKAEFLAWKASQGKLVMLI